MAEDQLQIILAEQNIDKENAQLLLKAFGAPFEEAGAILSEYRTIRVTDESQTDLMAEAREKRLTLKKIRTTVENKRKELKEDSLRTGRAIDSTARFVEENIKPAEQYLEAQEKFAENLAKERKARITAERRERLTQYDADPSMYKFEDMSEDSFESLVEVLKDRQEARIAAEKQAEADRIKKAEEEVREQERIREENEKLKMQAEEKEEAEEKKIERINRVSALGLRWDGQTDSFLKDDLSISKDEILSESDVSFDKIVSKIVVEIQRRDKVVSERVEAERKEQEAKLEAERAKADEERKKREALELEQKNKDAAEAKAKAQAEETKRKALLAPDKEKLLLLATMVSSIYDLGMPAVKSNRAQKVINYAETVFKDLVTYLEQKAKEL